MVEDRHQEAEQNPARGSTGVAIRTAGPTTGLGQLVHRSTRVPQGHHRPRPCHRVRPILGEPTLQPLHGTVGNGRVDRRE
eukprot:2682930-Rhodomonas_salina.1